MKRFQVSLFIASSSLPIIAASHLCRCYGPPQRFVVVASSRVGLSWRIHANHQGYGPLAAFGCSASSPWRVANSCSDTVLGVTILVELSGHFYPPGLRLPSHLSSRQAQNIGDGRVRNKAMEKTRLGMRCAD